MAIHVLQGARSSSARSKKVREGKIEEECKIREEVHVQFLDFKAPLMRPPLRCFLGFAVRRRLRLGRHEHCQAVWR